MKQTTTANASGGAVNAAPEVFAGDDDFIIGLSVALSGTATDDGGTPTVVWSQVSGPGVTVFTDATNVNTVATVNQVGTYVYRLTADDGTQTTSDSVEVSFAAAPDDGQLGSRKLMFTWGDDSPTNAFPSTFVNTYEYIDQQIVPIDGWFNFAHLGSGQALWYYGGQTGNNGGPAIMFLDDRLSNPTAMEITLQPAIDIQDLAANSELPATATSWLDVMIPYLEEFCSNSSLKLIIRLFHECNGSWFRSYLSGSDINRYGGGALGSNFIGFNHEYAADHAEAFRRVVDYIRNNLSTTANMQTFFMWAPNAFVPGATGSTVVDPTPAYPGSEHVDLLGASWYIATPGHNIGAPSPALTGTSPIDLTNVLTNLQAIDSSKPVGLGETAIAFGVASRGTRMVEYFETLDHHDARFVNWFWHDAKPGEPSWGEFHLDNVESTFGTRAAEWRASGDVEVPTFDGEIAVEAGPSTTVQAGVEVQLIGRVTDGNFTTAPYASVPRQWTMTSGPATPVFSDSSREFSRVTFPSAGTYTLQLEGTSSLGDVTDTVTFNVVSDITSTVTTRRNNMLTYLRSLTGSGRFLVGQQGVFGRNQYRNIPLAGGDGLDGPEGNSLGEGAVWPYDNGGAAWEALRFGLEVHDGTTEIPPDPFGPGGVPFTRLQLAEGSPNATFAASGHEPAFLGADIGGWAGVGEFYVDTNQAVHALIDHWHRGGIGHLGMQYLPSPLRSTSNGHFQSDADVDRILPGGDLRSVWEASLDQCVDALLMLQHHGVPVIWRPFGETHGAYKDGFNGLQGATPFWWQVGRPSVGEIFVTPSKSNELWTDMYDYFAAAGIVNAIWAWTPLWWNSEASFNSTLAQTQGGQPTYVPRHTSTNAEICEVVGWSQYVSPNVGYGATYLSPVYTAIQNMIGIGEISSNVVQWICEFGFGIHGSGSEPQIVPFDMNVALNQVSNMEPNVSIVSNWVTNGVDATIPPGSTGTNQHFAMYGLQSQTNTPSYMADSRTITLGQLPGWIFT